MILAYLDAGTGSLLLQAILGGVAGIAVFFRARLGWGKKREAEPDESKNEVQSEIHIDSSS